MAWLKGSDTALQHGAVLAPLAWKPDPSWPVTDGLLAALLYGIAQLCATHSAGMRTDYVVDDAVVAGVTRDPSWRMLADLIARAGYWERLADDTGWLLIDDQLLWHIRLASEIEWERARKADVANPAFTVPVRLRDGDGCRYCADIVSWSDRTGGRGGTYDHRQPGKAARTVDDLVVACRSCNSRRRDDPDALPLLPVPASPYYGTLSVAFLAKANVSVTLSTEPPRPRTQRDTAPSDLASSETPPAIATPHPAGHRVTRPRTQRDTATAPQSTPDKRDGATTGRPHRAARPTMPKRTDQQKRESTDPAARQATKAGDAGTGRAGQGRAPAPTTDPRTTPDQDHDRPTRRKRRRARRGKRAAEQP